MKSRVSIVMIIIFILCIAGGVLYFVLQNPAKAEEKLTNISYETINMLTNIRLGISGFDSVHPYLTQNREMIYINSLIFEPLLTILQDYTIEPCLAKEYSKVNEKSYIIKLKENSSWSNKEKLTAQDVKFSIEELQKLNTSIYYENVKEISKVEIIDEDTLRIELTKEIPFFEYQLIFPIISKSQYEKDPIKTSKQMPIGSGRYKIQRLEKDKIELTQNEQWVSWKEESSNTKTITIYLYETMGEVYNSFRVGTIDFVHTANNNVEEYIGSMGYGKKEYTSREYDYLAFNCENSILQFEEVRKAIQLALNKENLIATSLENTVVPSYFPLDDTHYLLKDIELKTTNDTKEAKKLLEESGWKYEYGIWKKMIDGRTKTINITLSVSKENEQRVKIAKEIQKQLEEVGIKIQIEEISNVKYQNYLKNHNFEILLTGIYTPISPDISYFIGANNLASYQNQDIAVLLKELNHITDKNLQKEKYQKIIQIYQKEVPYIGLYKTKETILYSTTFRGEITPNNYNIYYNLPHWYRQE